MWQIYVSCITCDIYYVLALICGRFSAYDYFSADFIHLDTDCGKFSEL